MSNQKTIKPKPGALLKSKQVFYYYNPKNKKIISSPKDSLTIFLKRELSTYYLFIDGDIVSIYHPGKHFVGYLFDKIDL